MSKITDIVQNFIRKNAGCKEKKSYFNKRILQRQEQIVRLENKKRKLVYPSWVNEIVKPIAELLTAKMTNCRYEILGPFGMTCETSIHFYEIDVEKGKELDNCKNITFRPGNLDRGEIFLVDYNYNTHKFQKGSIGEMNGMNHSSVPMKKTVVKLLEFIR